MGKLLHCDGASSRLCDMFTIKINAFIANIDLAWASRESTNLILPFTAEGTLSDNISFLFIIFPHLTFMFLLLDNSAHAYICVACLINGKLNVCL